MKRKGVVRTGCAAAALVLSLSSAGTLFAEDGARSPKKVAAVVTEYRHNSHADVICSRLFQTQTLDDKGRRAGMKLLTCFTDQVPASDTSRKWSEKYGFRLTPTVAEALTLGTGKLAVEGVLLVAEHGRYPVSPTGQVVYPKRRLFDEIVKVFRETGQVVPLFCDKHLADNWDDAKYLYDTARELKIPLMAGSSLPTLWRYPPADVRRGAKLKQLVALSHGSLDAYGFHGLEMVQCLIEQRAGGETGIASVQCLTGPAVWQAGAEGVYDKGLLEAAIRRTKHSPDLEVARLPELAKTPVLFVVDYVDGLRVNVFTMNKVVDEWASAWRYEDDTVESTLFYTQEARPFMHFALLVDGIDRMMQTGKPSWPAERTLMTSGALDALLISKKDEGRRLETPYLKFSYQSDWRWQEPPPPPPNRPIGGQ